MTLTTIVQDIKTWGVIVAVLLGWIALMTTVLIFQVGCMLSRQARGEQRELRDRRLGAPQSQPWPQPHADQWGQPR